MLNIWHFQILKLKYVNKYASSLAHKKNSLYLCNVFFMVLDLRLTIDGRRDDGHLFFCLNSHVICLGCCIVTAIRQTST